MPDNKNQHVVPQFHLRRFSVDDLGRRINTYLISHGRVISGASIRDQASKSYFYGQETAGHINFQRLESDSAKLLEDIVHEGPPALDSPEFIVLSVYIVCQLARTPYHAQAVMEAYDKTWDAAVSLHPRPEIGARLPRPQLNQRQATNLSLLMTRDSAFYLQGLEIKLIKNSSRLPFVCGDNPVVRYNQFLEARHARGGITGYLQKGVQIFFPIGPNHCLLFSDPTTYKVGTRRSNILEVQDAKDILEINRLQYLSADKCVYFGTGVSDADINELVRQSQPFRRSSKFDARVVRAVVPDGRLTDLVSLSEHDIRCGLSPSFVKLRKRARRLDSGAQNLIRNPALDHFARAEWEARRRARLTSLPPDEQ